MLIMKFKSDAQRKAVMLNLFSKDNKFTLYASGRQIRSTDIPSVNVGFYDEVDMSKPSVSKLDNVISGIDESHLAGLDYLIVAPKEDKMLDKGKTFGQYNIRGRESAIIIIDPDVIDKYGIDEVLSHELGHHMVDTSLSPTYIKQIGKYGQEVLAEQYKEDFTGKPNRYVHPEDEAAAKDILSYATTLQELKNPSIREQMKYAGEI